MHRNICAVVYTPTARRTSSSRYATLLGTISHASFARGREISKRDCQNRAFTSSSYASDSSDITHAASASHYGSGIASHGQSSSDQNTARKRKAEWKRTQEVRAVISKTT